MQIRGARHCTASPHSCWAAAPTAFAAPTFGTQDDFIEAEEMRRGLSHGALMPLLRQPFYDKSPSFSSLSDFKLYKTARGDGILFGSGEKLGEWEAFSLFYTMPQKQVLYSLEIGQEVTVGTFPYYEDAVVARILRGTKPAKGGKTQFCYYALLKTATGFQYCGLQHVHNPGTVDYIHQGWIDDTCHFGKPPKANQLASFRPKSVAAAAQAAARYVASLQPPEDSESSDDDAPKKKKKKHK
jgi:hypothetical protein